MTTLILALGLAAATSAAAAGGGEATRPAAVRIWAVENGARDLVRSVAFYTEALGFSIERRDPTGVRAQLRNGECRLVLSVTGAPPAPDNAARIYLNLSVGDLDVARERVVAAGGRLASPDARESAVGPFLEVLDPAGNVLHLIDHPWDEMSAGDPSACFNIGLHVLSIPETETFLTRLGFEVATRDYMPKTLVFARRGIGYLVLHPLGEDGEPASDGFSAGALIVEADDPAATVARASREAGGEPALSLRDPSGNLIRIVPAGGHDGR